MSECPFVFLETSSIEVPDSGSNVSFRNADRRFFAWGSFTESSEPALLCRLGRELLALGCKTTFGENMAKADVIRTK